jgi:hypothetical protein
MPDVPAKLTRIPSPASPPPHRLTTAAFEAIAATLPLGSVGSMYLDSAFPKWFTSEICCCTGVYR